MNKKRVKTELKEVDKIFKGVYGKGHLTQTELMKLKSKIYLLRSLINDI